jgi:predicted Zn finger-like uncharacterized protein
MNVTCPNCATVYRVDPAKVPEAGVRARCSICSAVFAVQGEAQERPAATGTRPVNPFLSQDPALKARRLARALISDMVVYHPAKRQEGLRDGNLRELFDEEIKKSWEEYADQVGKNVADTTPYFKEALNEILAGGRQIF